LKQARRLAEKHLNELFPLLAEGWILVGLEPSAILSFRDEYRRFGLEVNTVEAVGSKSLLIEEFLAAEISEGNVEPSRFSNESRKVKIHNHCHQKALSDQKVTFDMLNLPENYSVSIISSGCCGMAGSFGYEAEHYDVSMKIGEQRLFPAIRKAGEDVLIAANGTSCRHQIRDGTGRQALHPVSILRQALLPR
jgi:Fe-S oxidoreductase